MIYEDLYGFRIPAWIFSKKELRMALKLGMLKIVGGYLKARGHVDINQNHCTDKTYSTLYNEIREKENIASEPNVYEDKEEIAHDLRDIGSPAFTSNGVAKRRYRKKVLMDIRGGECEKCGHNENFAALDFHHPKKKNFVISSALTEFTDRQFEEVLIPEVREYTVLLCANCHRKEHHETCTI